MNLKKLFNIADAETPTWRGVEGSKFRWHGALGDPEVEYRGKLFNEVELEDFLWEIYEDDCKSKGIEPTEEGYNNFATAEEAESVLELYYNNGGWTEDLEAEDEEDEISDSVDEEDDGKEESDFIVVNPEDKDSFRVNLYKIIIHNDYYSLEECYCYATDAQDAIDIAFDYLNTSDSYPFMSYKEVFDEVKDFWFDNDTNVSDEEIDNEIENQYICNSEGTLYIPITELDVDVVE